jgi:hypothetical protein
MGRPVKKSGAVLYLCGEGFGGIGARIKACKIHHQIEDGAPIYVVRHQLNLRSSQEDFNALMLAIVQLVEQTGIQFELAIVDTLARAFGGGNENSSEDMGAFITAMGKVQEFLNCALMVLHHCGKDTAKGLRGHSSLLGAVDTELELLRFDEQMKGVLTISKQKDGADNDRFGFEMVEVEIRSAGLGLSDPVVSLAVQASDLTFDENPKASKGNTGKGKNQRLEMLCLEKMVKEHGSPKYIEGLQRHAIRLEQWRQELWSKMGCTDEDKGTFKTAWHRAKQRLLDSGEGGIRDDFVWLQHKPMDFDAG